MNTLYISFPSCFTIIIILVYEAYIQRQETGQYDELSNVIVRLEEYTSLNVTLDGQQNRYLFVCILSLQILFSTVFFYCLLFSSGLGT